MAIISVPTARVALGFHLCGTGAVLSGSVSPYAFFPLEVRWPNVAENQYIPNPSTENVFVDGFGDSLFFNFPTGSNLGGGIQAFMSDSTSAAFGEVKIPNSTIHNNYTSIYVSSCGSFNPRSLAGVTDIGATGLGGAGRFDIWWDFESNYPGGFELIVNSKVFGSNSGAYLGISDQCGITPGISTCFVNGNGPDGTNTTTYFNDSTAPVTDLSILIPWKDILAVEAIFIYFVSGDPI
jgi:hypothetical protein